MIRPHYHFGIELAAQQTVLLGMKDFSVIEFGVAGGNGLIAMEESAKIISSKYNINIEIYGFDIISGLPKPKDYRDLPYGWKSGFFKMDYEKLSDRLEKSKLIIGDVSETTKTFFQITLLHL